MCNSRIRRLRSGGRRRRLAGADHLQGTNSMQNSAIIEYKHDGYLCEGLAVAPSTVPTARSFPPPWTIHEANDACFIVRDANGQAPAYFYFDDEPGRRSVGQFADAPRRGPGASRSTIESTNSGRRSAPVAAQVRSFPRLVNTDRDRRRSRSLSGRGHGAKAPRPIGDHGWEIGRLFAARLCRTVSRLDCCNCARPVRSSAIGIWLDNHLHICARLRTLWALC